MCVCVCLRVRFGHRRDKRAPSVAPICFCILCTVGANVHHWLHQYVAFSVHSCCTDVRPHLQLIFVHTTVRTPMHYAHHNAHHYWNYTKQQKLQTLQLIFLGITLRTTQRTDFIANLQFCLFRHHAAHHIAHHHAHSCLHR